MGAVAVAVKFTLKEIEEGATVGVPKVPAIGTVRLEYSETSRTSRAATVTGSTKAIEPAQSAPRSRPADQVVISCPITVPKTQLPVEARAMPTLFELSTKMESWLGEAEGPARAGLVPSTEAARAAAS